jgi:hypothetical protein
MGSKRLTASDFLGGSEPCREHGSRAVAHRLSSRSSSDSFSTESSSLAPRPLPGGKAGAQ